MLYVYIAVLSLMCARSIADNTSADIANELRLHHDLRSNYNTDVRPAATNEPVHVDLGLSVVRLTTFDTDKELFECHAWLQMTWNDMSLRWDPAQYGGVSQLTMLAKNIWRPDIKLYTSTHHDDNLDPMVNALVYSDGTIMYIPRVTLQSHCTINRSSDGTPLNTQHCPLKFGSWVYNGNMVMLGHHNNLNAIDLSNYVPKTKYDWFITEANGKLTLKKYSCCAETYPDITFDVVLTRETIPPVVDTSDVKEEKLRIRAVNAAMVLLVPTVFLLPPESKEKMTLGSAVLISLSVLLANEKTHYAGVFCEINMILVVISLVVSAIILNVWHNCSAGGQLPNCLQRVVSILARICCVGKRFSSSNSRGDRVQLQEADGDMSVHVTPVKQPDDWRTLVLVIDRLLFVIHFIVTIVCNISAS